MAELEDPKTRAATSSVLTKFPQKQVQEMKEAFTMIDQNRDGFIDLNDLKEMYSSLGSTPPDKQLDEMLKEAPGPLNFTMFLSLFSEKLSGTDPENTILQSFKMFDEQTKGHIEEEYLKDLLENMGDNFTKDEIKQTWKQMPLEAAKVNYPEFVKLLKGKEEEVA